MNTEHKVREKSNCSETNTTLLKILIIYLKFVHFHITLFDWNSFLLLLGKLEATDGSNYFLKFQYNT